MKIFSQQAGTLDSTFGNNGVVYVDSNLQYVPYLDAQNRLVSLFRENDSTLVMYRHHIDGTVDNTFGNNGQLFLHRDSADIRLLQIQSDDKILCAGTIQHIPDTISTNQIDFFVARFLPDGSADTLFGNQGIVIIDFGQNEFINDITMYNDSLILVSGYTGLIIWTSGITDLALFRLLPNGTLDNSFGLGGKVITNISPYVDRGGPMVILPDDKIVMAASCGYFTLIKYEINGLLDSTFNNDGIAIDSISFFNTYAEIALEDDLSIIVAGGEGSVFGGGFYYKLNKYSSNGAIDSSFAVNGTYESSWNGNFRTFSSLQIQSDHKIITTGVFNDSLLLMRFTSQGNPDVSFASNGMVLNQFDGLRCSGNLVCLVPNDKITVVGLASNQVDTNKVFIARYNNDILNVNPFELSANNFDVAVYPNPATQHFTISLSKNFDKVDLIITDVTGKIIYNATVSQIHKIDIETKDFAEGVYLVRIQSEYFIETRKVVIVK